MLKSIFRISIMVVTGAFLKPRIKGLLILLGFWLLLWFLQSEYLNYVDYSGDTNYILQVSIIKVGLILFSLLVYVLTVERRVYLNRAKKIAGKANSSGAENIKEDDGFDAIRHKKKLKGRAAKLLDD